MAAKQVFAIMLDRPDQRVVERMGKEFPKPKSYSHTDVLHLVAVRSDVLTKDVAAKLGIRGESDIGAVGVVFKLNAAYSGFTNPALWEWLSAARA